MLLPEAMGRSDAVEADRFEELPSETLQAMLEAGREALECRRILAKSGDNLVGEVLKHEGPFYVLDHYPKGDVFDPESHAQWYYHAHDKKDRPGEHGHFHTFMRGGGMPDGVQPAPLPDFIPKAERHDLVCHLIAISMDRAGWPIGLFTTNRRSSPCSSNRKTPRTYFGSRSCPSRHSSRLGTQVHPAARTTR